MLYNRISVDISPTKKNHELCPTHYAKMYSKCMKDLDVKLLKLFQETRENLKKTYHLKELEKEEKAQSQQKKRNNTD